MSAAGEHVGILRKKTVFNLEKKAVKRKRFQGSHEITLIVPLSE